MESQPFAIDHEEAVGGGRLNGDQVGRTIHVVYFLSRNGRVEQPHLIRIQPSSCCNGVRLKDVKKWLSDVRGKDMPNSFSWSNKRRYKTGYIWQDLHDDDLIVPLSDNEYVLKGSEIPEASSPENTMITPKVCPSDNGQTITTHEHPSTEVGPNGSKRSFLVAGSDAAADNMRCESLADKRHQESHGHDHLSAVNSINSDNVNPFGVASMERQSRAASARTIDSLSDSSTNQTDDDEDHHDSMQVKQTSSRRSKARSADQSRSEAGADREQRKTTDQGEEERGHSGSAEGRERRRKSGSSRRRRSSCSSGGAASGAAYSRFLKNLLTCRAVETEDSMVTHAHAGSKFSSACREEKDVAVRENTVPRMEMSSAKRGTSGTNQHAGGNTWKSHESARKRRTGAGKNQKSSFSEDYRPRPEPTCSHCGKKFNPEKLGSHMRSCKGLKQNMSQAAGHRRKTTGVSTSGEVESAGSFGHPANRVAIVS